MDETERMKNSPPPSWAISLRCHICGKHFDNWYDYQMRHLSSEGDHHADCCPNKQDADPDPTN